MNKLTHFPICPFSRAVRLAMAELDIEFEHIEQRPWEVDQKFLRLNPSGELPVLQIDGGPTICGVYAISEYLSEADFGNATQVAHSQTESSAHSELDELDILVGASNAIALLPGHVEQRAEVRRLVDWFHGRLNREVTREFLHEKIYGRMMFGSEHTPSPEILRVVRGHLRYHLGYISTLARDRRWMAGDEYSLADIAAAAQLSSTDYLGEISWNEFPFVKEWYARVKSRRAFRSLLRDRVPGVAPPAYYDDLDF